MMERLWVALLVAGIATLFSSGGWGVCGSVLHGIAAGPDYLHWIPPELFYANVHSPLVLSQLHHGLRFDDRLNINDRNEQEQSQPAPVVEESSSALFHVPLSDEDLTGTTTVKAITQEELYEALFGRQTGSSAGDNAIEDETQSFIHPSQQSKTRVSTTAEVALPVEATDAPIIITQEQRSSSRTKPKNIAVETTAAVHINAEPEATRLEMEAAVASGVEQLNVTVGTVPKLDDKSNAEINAAELPASGASRDSKPNILTNVNVNVNVNGDGKGSVINSTSVAEITPPIKTHHKKCD